MLCSKNSFLLNITLILLFLINECFNIFYGTAYFFSFVLEEIRIQLRALCMVGKCDYTELPPSPGVNNCDHIYLNMNIAINVTLLIYYILYIVG